MRIWFENGIWWFDPWWLVMSVMLVGYAVGLVAFFIGYGVFRLVEAAKEEFSE